MWAWCEFSQRARVHHPKPLPNSCRDCSHKVASFLQDGQKNEPCRKGKERSTTGFSSRWGVGEVMHTHPRVAQTDKQRKKVESHQKSTPPHTPPPKNLDVVFASNEPNDRQSSSPFFGMSFVFSSQKRQSFEDLILGQLYTELDVSGLPRELLEILEATPTVVTKMVSEFVVFFCV